MYSLRIEYRVPDALQRDLCDALAFTLAMDGLPKVDRHLRPSSLQEPAYEFAVNVRVAAATARIQHLHPHA